MTIRLSKCFIDNKVFEKLLTRRVYSKIKSIFMKEVW